MFNLQKKTDNENKEKIVRPFLCDQVKKFGFCKGPCVERHTLCKLLDKKYRNIPTKCFISIQLIKIITASHFIGRILKYSTVKDPTYDSHWIKIDDSFEIIKNELQVFCLLPESKIIHKNYVIGEMVMIETKRGELFRAIVLDIVNGWFSVKIKVTLIDLGHTMEIGSNKVFVLPSHLKEIPPVAVEVIVTSIEPIGEEGVSIFDWPLTTTNFISSLLEPIILSNIELICKVELTFGITFWIDWMLVKKCIKCSHSVCKQYQKSLILPRELIERNLAKSNLSIINKLLALSKDAQLWEEDFSIDNLKKESTIIKKSNIPLFSYEERVNKIDNSIEVQWAHLSKDIIYNVSVCTSVHPKCIIVRNLKFLKLINDIQNDIDKAIKNKTVTQLTCATVGTVCLALSPMSLENKYNRVIIQQIKNETAIIYYVDYGESNKVKIENLLSIPPNLITKLPFQTIECKLSGFKDMLWTDSIIQFNERFMQLTDTVIYLKVISFSWDTELTGGNLYEIVLFNDDININVKMANEFNKDVEIDNAQIQNIISLNFKYNESENEEECDEDIDNQLILLNKLLKSNAKDEKEINLNSHSQDLSQNSIINKSIETNEKQIVTNETNLNQSIIVNKKQNITHKKYKMKKQYCLDCNVIPVIPQCFWHQDEKWIYFKLNVLSINTYDIQHTMDTITISVVTDSTSYYLTLVLYAFITEELFTCHINFDGIHVKAQKLIQVKYKWPRLVKCSKNHKYIIYDTEYVTEHKDWNFWFQIMNKYKMNALNLPLNVQNYCSESDNSDADQYTIFED